ncbi:MAG: MFS transporter [Chthoniobacterales bacterium]|nr:MFS transporter [Chthoniobacterales bacterium]
MHQHVHKPQESVTQDGQTLYRCGTLVYTKAGLFALFTWMLWGDFCFTLLETIWPNILPLVLKSNGAPNFMIALVMATIPQAMNFVMNPIISTASDRFRGKRGRRIPFLLVATPFISFFLILLGFAKELGQLLYTWFGALHPSLTPALITVGLISVLVVCFRFFELFVATVFWYLFNDVVPSALMGRFLGFFRVIGSLAGALFNFFVFQYAESHTSVIFLGGAVLYGTAFLLMCLNVKEGEYPPPDKMSEKKGFSLAPIKTFFKECFTAKIFRLVFSYSVLQGVAGATGIFLIFMAFSIGLTKDEVGKVAGVAAVIGMLLMFPMGVLVDKFHPLRVMLVAQVGYCVVNLLKCVFLFYDFPRDTAFWIYAALAGISIPVFTANTAAGLPMVMRIFPHERFGQFCAANAMCGALGGIVAGVLAGAYLDTLKNIFSTSGDYYYRFVPVWSFFFMLLATFATFLIYREWKKLGGDTHYRPPIEDKFADYHDSAAP